MEQKVEVSIDPLLLTHRFPHYQHPPPEVHSQQMNLPWHIAITQNPQLYMRTHSWWSRFCGFWQICTDMYPPLLLLWNSFAALKIHCVSSVYPSLPQLLATTDLFYHLHRFSLSKMSHSSWNHLLCSLFGLATFTEYMHLRFLFSGGFVKLMAWSDLLLTRWLFLMDR